MPSIKVGGAEYSGCLAGVAGSRQKRRSRRGNWDNDVQECLALSWMFTSNIFLAMSIASGGSNPWRQARTVLPAADDDGHWRNRPD